VLEASLLLARIGFVSLAVPWEQGAVGAARRPVIDIFEGRLVAEQGLTQAVGELLVVAIGLA